MKTLYSRSPLRSKSPNSDTPQRLIIDNFIQNPQIFTGTGENMQVFLNCLAESVKTHSSAIRELEKSISARVTMAEFSAAIATKVDFTEISSKIAEIRMLLDKKVDLIDLDIKTNENHGRNSVKIDNAIESLDKKINNKIDSKEFWSVIQDLINKREKNVESDLDKSRKCENYARFTRETEEKLKNVEKLADKWNKTLEKLKVEIESLKKANPEKEIKAISLEIHSKADMNYVANQILAQKSHVTQLFSAFSSEIKQNYLKTQEVLSDHIKTIQKVCEKCENDLNYLKNSKALTFCSRQNTLASSFSEFLQEFSTFKKTIFATTDDLSNKLEKIQKAKPEKEEIREALHEINKQLHMKLEKRLIRSNPDKDTGISSAASQYVTHSHKSSEESPFNYSFSPGAFLSSSKAPSFATLFPDFHDEIAKRFGEIHKELVLKCSIKEICTLLDMKANVEDVNVALQDIHKELDEKCN